MPNPPVWSERAAAAEQLVTARYVRPWRQLPRTALGLARPVTGSIATAGAHAFNYWWQAHLLDVLADAEHRAPHAGRRRLMRRLVRTVWLRNAGWCNDFHDDMAWLALALPRAEQVGGGRRDRGHAVLLQRLLTDRDADGLLSWRRSDRFRNVPANAPAAIVFARAGHVDAAARIVRWILDTMIDPATGLIIDGVQADGHREERLYTYNQGVVLGAVTELDAAGVAGEWRSVATDLITAVGRHLAPDGVLIGDGGGDGGLFAGICARYLALAAQRFDLDSARTIVQRSAAAAWAHRHPDDGAFGIDWSRVDRDDHERDQSRDLSVQLSGWMVLEAAARL